MWDPLRELVEREVVVEREGWAPERANRVTARLQAAVPEAARLDTLVIWLDGHNAFTGPGRTIYLSRRLLERMPDDDAAALVVAHELAHHHLGHVPRLSRSWYFLPLQVVLYRLRRNIVTAARERDADLLAIELCVDAGYDGERCVAAFELLDRIVLDYGDLDGSFGAEAPGASQPSHDPVKARIAAVRAHLERVRAGHRISLDVTRDREARRRKVMLAAVGGAVVTVALVLLRRRP